jgi:uncharacterized membrane protein
MASASKSKFASLRTAFLSGLVLLAPLAVTWFVFSWLVDRVGGAFRPIFFFYLPDWLAGYPGMGLVLDVLTTVLVIALITGLGYLSRYVISHYFGQMTERLIETIPGVSTVYRSVKQIVVTFSAQKRAVFERVVLIPFPRDGSYAIGFLTNRAQGEVQARTDEEVWTVFVPTTPNPTSGFLVMVPREDIISLDMSVGDAMKLIISGGTVAPPWPPPPAAPKPATPELVAPTPGSSAPLP